MKEVPEIVGPFARSQFPLIGVIMQLNPLISKTNKYLR
jgi:hypothetical protein